MFVQSGAYLGAGLWQPDPVRSGDMPRIAVLPFDDFSAGTDKDYLSDAIAEGIITELARSKTYAVIARNSSFRYRGQATDDHPAPRHPVGGDGQVIPPHLAIGEGQHSQRFAGGVGLFSGEFEQFGRLLQLVGADQAAGDLQRQLLVGGVGQGGPSKFLQRLVRFLTQLLAHAGGEPGMGLDPLFRLSIREKLLGSPRLI